MNESRVTKWITIATNLAVLAGLILLVMEIRQNNNLAKLQALQERRNLIQQSEMEYYDPEISKVWVKSIMEPENMTLPEIRAIEAYIDVQLYQAGHIWSLGQAGLMSEEETREWMFEDVNYLFSNTFAQTWWQVWGSNWSHLTDLDEAISSVDENQTKRDFETIQRLLKERVSSAKDAD
jgi:hypothetical protein